jgi:hypothetical protein
MHDLRRLQSDAAASVLERYHEHPSTTDDGADAAGETSVFKADNKSEANDVVAGIARRGCRS